MDKHIEEFHIKEEEEEDMTNISISLDDYISNRIASTSYVESSSLETYFKENHCIESNSFPYEYQRNAIKNIITIACTQKRGVMSISKSICDRSFTIFFAIAQIAFLANDLVLKYLSVILSIVIPLWRNATHCNLEIPTSLDAIKSVVTSSNNMSMRSLMPMPSMEEIDEHSYCSLQSLLAYTTMTSNNNPQALKQRYLDWMNAKSCSTFSNRVKTLSQGSGKPAVAVFMVFWSDGFDPNNSMKRNRHSVWILTVTFFFFDVTSRELYMVESCLVAMGPGKGAAESKEDHTCIFERLRYDLDAIHDNFDDTPIPFTFVSRAHKGSLCNFYLCKEIYFSTPRPKTNSNIHIMDNPERRTNFGLLAGNSKNHAYFGLSCNFKKLQLPFEACVKCRRNITKYCEGEEWMNERATIPTCKMCHGFSIEHLLQHGKYKEPVYTPSNDINQSELPGHHLFSKPGMLTNDLLIDAYISARDFFLRGEMSETSIEGYLGTLCFNARTIDHLVEQCRLYQLSQDVACQCPGITRDDEMEVSLAKELSPYKTIEKPSPPPLLYICDLDCSIETIMHLGMNVSKH